MPPDASATSSRNAHVVKQAQVHLALVLERDSEPITGSLEDEHGHRRSFQGWMELAASLESLLLEVADSGDADAESAERIDRGGA